MAVRTTWTAGDVLTAADLTDTFGAKANVSQLRILQVVSGTTTTSVTNNSSTYVDTGLTATITPSSSSNKVLVLVSQNGVLKINSTYVNVRLMRGATEIAASKYATNTNNDDWNVDSISIFHLDSPATTSAVTYKTQQNSNANIATAATQYNGDTSTIILMEVAA